MEQYKCVKASVKKIFEKYLKHLNYKDDKNIFEYNDVFDALYFIVDLETEFQISLNDFFENQSYKFMTIEGITEQICKQNVDNYCNLH